MGLDITAYSNLTKVENPKFEDGELVNYSTEWWTGKYVIPEWTEKHWPGRSQGIENDTVYTWDKQYEFRAGSYSGYGWWRRKLDEFSKGNSFQELIDFADNEGIIGSVVSAKLANDFARNKTKAIEYSKTFIDGKYWFEQYKNWHKAFEMAADNGAIDFH